MLESLNVRGRAIWTQIIMPKNQDDDDGDEYSLHSILHGVVCFEFIATKTSQSDMNSYRFFYVNAKQ